MPKKRTSSRFRRSRRSSRRTGNLAKTLRNRGKNKVGLNTRVTLANRNEIRQIKKSRDTKMCDTIQAIAANQFDGQFCDDIQVDQQGTEIASNVPFSPSLLRIDQGAAHDNRVGQWVQMKSLTMKYCVSAGPRQPYQKIFLMLVLDREGDRGSGGDLSQVLALTTAGAVANKYALAYQNLNNTGKMGRFKILWRTSHLLSSPLMITNNVPPIGTVAGVPGNPNLPNVNRTTYNNQEYHGARYPERQYGSVTIKRPYKLNYTDEGGERTPENQTIRLYAWTDSTTTPTDGAPVTLQYYCRFRFKDS